jgi:hypothetical protein
MLTFYTTYIKQGIVWMVLCEGTHFPSPIIIPNFLACSYLIHHKFNYNFFLHKILIPYIYFKLILVLEVVKNDEDEIKNSKII